jgi:Ferredoxin subunits of nitrite reductase and ring-hydroxylating dioxygenases
MTAHRVGPAAEVGRGTVIGVGRYAVGNNGSYFAVTRRCRHLGADLAEGSIDDAGCLVCPWHRSAYDVTTGRMVRGPQGAFAKVPGLGQAYQLLTAVLPLRRAKITQQGDDLYLE